MTKRLQQATKTAARIPDPNLRVASKPVVVVLASGSGGNCLFVQFQDRKVILDAGIPPNEARDRARSVGWSLVEPVEAVLLTHIDSDHSAYATAFCEEYHCPLVCSSYTYAQLAKQPAKWVRAKAGERLDLPTGAVYPLPVDHVEGSLAYHLSVDDLNIVVLNDLGQTNAQVLAAVSVADCLLIESNHDVEMEKAAPYDLATIERNLSDHGHLSNDQAVEALTHCDPARLRCVTALHISREANRPELVRQLLGEAIRKRGLSASLYLASQDTPLVIDLGDEPKRQAVDLEAERPSEIDHEVQGLVAGQRRSNEETQRRAIRLAELTVEMRGLFERKDPAALLCNCQDFTAWTESRIGTPLGLGRRQMFLYLGIGERLLPAISKADLEQMSVNAMDALAWYAKHKGEAPSPELIEAAKTETASRVKSRVIASLFPGKTGHFEGPKEGYLIEAGKERIDFIKAKLEELKGKIGTEDEGEIIEYALDALGKELDQAQEEAVRVAAQQAAAGAPGPPDISWLRDEGTDGEAK